jgi:H(+)-translocating pyrophosphatase
MSVCGLGLLGLSSLYLIFTYVTSDSTHATVFGVAGNYASTTDNFFRVFNKLAGFGFGASTIGMFARVGGGVFTKAADVGSDLVGKVEQGIPEDDPRNPAVIADNVGDNVGDVAGMGADLFESYVGAIIATAALAPRLAASFADTSLTLNEYTKDFNAIMDAGVALPFWINGAGIIASLIGIAVVRNTKLADGTSLETLLATITNGVWVASIFTTGFTAGIVALLFKSVVAWKLFGATVIGLVAGVVIAKFTEYCTAYEFSPTREISEASAYGPAPVIIKGMGVGLLSVSVPMISTVVSILAANQIAGQYAVAIAAVGLLSTLGITLATDAYGPVADNAGGIAEMAQLPKEVRSRTDALDSLGNTTAATGKGLAIASATLTAVGLIAAFVEQSGLTRTTGGGTPLAMVGGDVPGSYARVADLSDSVVLAGVLVGAGLPMIFAALTMLSVDRGSRAIITEVRLQFATAPKLMKGDLTQVVDGHTYPDSTRCVVIATEAAIQEMVLPGVLAVFVPVAVGFLLGPKGTCGMLAGALGGCFMLATTMATAGGAWDNAKKWATRCGEDGEPTKWAEDGKNLPADQDGVTFVNFGIKKAEDFPKLLAEHGIHAFVKDKKTLGSYDSADAKARLQADLGKTYYNRHSATVVGDTVGDPFKDTSGPSLNVLIKTMTMMALMLAPAYKSFVRPPARLRTCAVS